MLELEDEPEDVQNASPVAEEIKNGEIDKIIKKIDTSPKYKTQKVKHCCKKKVSIGA
jgi:hypothetical protein